MKIKKQIGVILFFVLGFVSVVLSSVPDELPYSGRYRELGYSFTGTKNIDLDIYDSPNGGSTVCPQMQFPNTAFFKGMYSFYFKPQGIDWRNGPYYLQTTIDNKVMKPRMKITGSIYAMHSRTAEDMTKKSTDGSITFKIDNTAIVEVSSKTVTMNKDTVMNASLEVKQDLKVAGSIKGNVDATSFGKQIYHSQSSAFVMNITIPGNWCGFIKVWARMGGNTGHKAETYDFDSDHDKLSATCIKSYSTGGTPFTVSFADGWGSHNMRIDVTGVADYANVRVNFIRVDDNGGDITYTVS